MSTDTGKPELPSWRTPEGKLTDEVGLLMANAGLARITLRATLGEMDVSHGQLPTLAELDEWMLRVRIAAATALHTEAEVIAYMGVDRP